MMSPVGRSVTGSTLSPRDSPVVELVGRELVQGSAVGPVRCFCDGVP